MATLLKRNRIYYIVFSTRINGELFQKRFTLGTRIKREAEKKKLEYEDLYMEGKIDPFGGWTPKKHEAHQSKLKSNAQLVTLAELADKFVDERSQANQVSKDNYIQIINLLKQEVGDTMPVVMISEKDIRNVCLRTSLSPSSQANYLRHLKVFFNWLSEKGFVQNDVSKSIKKPKIKQSISKKVISEDELDKIMHEYRQDISSKKNKGQITSEHQSRVWFRPVVMTAFYAGLRRKEIISLCWENVHFNSEQIVVTDTKSGKERSVPIRKRLFNVLKAWHRYNNHPDNGLVFPSTKAYYKNSKMGPRNVSRVFKIYVRMANLSDSINFHGLRHSCVTELLKLGFDINEVAKIAGHSSLEVTKKYEHLTRKDLSNKMKKLEKERDEKS